MCDEDADQRILLGLLLENVPSLLHHSEPERELDWPVHRVRDALSGLRRAGLAHGHCEFGFASQAADAPIS